MRANPREGQKALWGFLGLLACAVVALCLAAQLARADESPSDYQIYPSVHEMTYGDSWILHPSANVLVEDGIDADTRARLDEALALKDIDATPVTEVPAGGYQMNVLVGVKDSGGAVDTYVDQLVSSGALTPADGLFEKSDAYLLVSLKGDAHAADTTVVLGRDTDSAFYGLTTLYQFFQQLEGTLRLRGFVCSDWADVVSRGFIEGYYGNPWSTEDRVNLMTWGGYYKLNAYVYAPKDDPLHRINWRGLYTDEEIARELRPQAEAGNRSKVRFVYAPAPFHNSDGARRPFRFDSEAHYQEDLADLKAKYLQTIDAGVRQIALLADDSTDWGRLYGNEATYLRILNDLTSWIHELQALRDADGTPRYEDLKDTILYCPALYSYTGGGESWYRRMPESVQVVMTGGRTFGIANHQYAEKFKGNTGRAPFLWINWPCTDMARNFSFDWLTMGGHNTFLRSDVVPGDLSGIMLNPMQ